MKRLFLLILTFLCITSSFAQKCTIANAKMNVFYGGLPNPIDVTVDGIPTSSLILTTDNGDIIRGYEDLPYDFTYTPKKIGVTTIYVKSKTSKGFKTIDSLVARVKKVPTPNVYISNNSESIKVWTGLIVVLQNFEFDVRFTVEQCTFSLTRGNKEIFRSKSIGEEFNADTKLMLKEVKIGDYIVIDNIRAIGPLGLRYDLHKIFLTVKEEHFHFRWQY